MASHWKFLLKNWNYILTIFIGIIAIVLSNLGKLQVDLLLQSILIVICILAINQITMHNEIKSRLEVLKDGVTNVKKVDIDELFSSLRNAVINAKKSIDLTSIDKSDPSDATYLEDEKARQEYFKTINSIIKSNKIKVRRITSVNSIEKLNKLKSWTIDYKDCSNFHIKYTEVDKNALLQVLSIQVVDSKKVFLLGKDRTLNEHIIIESEVLGKVFQNYYDSYWNSLKSIKTKTCVNDELIKIIQNEINANRNRIE